MADIIHVRREPHGAGLTRVTEEHYELARGPFSKPTHEVVRYEHREPEPDGAHFNGNFAAIVIGGLALALFVLIGVSP